MYLSNLLDTQHTLWQCIDLCNSMKCYNYADLQRGVKSSTLTSIVRRNFYYRIVYCIERWIFDQFHWSFSDSIGIFKTENEIRFSCYYYYRLIKLCRWSFECSSPMTPCEYSISVQALNYKVEDHRTTLWMYFELWYPSPQRLLYVWIKVVWWYQWWVLTVWKSGKTKQHWLCLRQKETLN